MLSLRISSKLSASLLARSALRNTRVLGGAKYFCATDDVGAEFRATHQITIKNLGEKSYEPMTDFSTAPFADSLKRVFTNEGFSSPTAIQAQSWPIIMDKRDVISVARTGSGKTVGFLMPALQNLWAANKNKKAPPKQRVLGRNGRMMTVGGRGRGARPPTALVLAPTRELAVQIDQEAQKYCRAAFSQSACLYGGASKGLQIQQLRNGADLVIATPGRCNDLIEMGVLDLSDIEYLVLDEADRMLDMGFEPQIRQILDNIPDERQTAFFTATWPREVQSLAMDFLNNPVHITIGETGVLNANKAITQEFIMTKEFKKEEELFNLMDRIGAQGPGHKRAFPKTLVFVSRKDTADHLCATLSADGFPSGCLHGDMTQRARSMAMDRFRAGKMRVLVATDVAGRGLDVKDIENVINYDFPDVGGGVEDYVHRIGRTARADNVGFAYTLLTPLNLNSGKRMEELVGVLQRSEQPVPPEVAEKVVAFQRRNGGFGGRGGGRPERSRYGEGRGFKNSKTNRGGDRFRERGFGSDRSASSDRGRDRRDGGFGNDRSSDRSGGWERGGDRSGGYARGGFDRGFGGRDRGGRRREDSFGGERAVAPRRERPVERWDAEEDVERSYESHRKLTSRMNRAQSSGGRVQAYPGSSSSSGGGGDDAEERSSRGRDSREVGSRRAASPFVVKDDDFGSVGEEMPLPFKASAASTGTRGGR